MTDQNRTLAIVMAEDDPDDRLLTQQAMQEGHLLNRLDCVQDGVELMEYLRHEGRHADRYSGSPGIILLDLNMPRMDGREALKEIKSDPSLRHIPVIVLTTSQAEEDIFRSYDMGASSFITKPVTFEGLVEVMKTMKRYWFEILELPPVKLETGI